MLIFFFHVTLRYVTFKKSWIRHCALVKSWIRHRARYVTLRYVYKILDPPLSLVKSCIRHCARYFTLRYVYKILDPPPCTCEILDPPPCTLRYVTLRLQNPGSANVNSL